MIPKIIHQTFSSNDNIPPIFYQNIDNIKKMNFNYHYRFYDDNDILKFIKDNYDLEMVDLYRCINPKYGASRADFFRYLLIYKIGGIYLDIKSSSTIPLDEIILESDQYILTNWPNSRGEIFENWGRHRQLTEIRGEFQNWHIIAEPNHPFLHKIISNTIYNIKNYTPKRYGVGKPGVLLTTGPIMYTLSIIPILSLFSHRIAGTHLDLGLKYSISEKQGSSSHVKYFKNHYSKLKEPIILNRSIKLNK